MQLGKHVYCEKPLAHSIYEARLMTQVAAKTNFAIKSLPRRGYIGFQDHRQKVWYKNVKLLELHPD